MIAIGVGFSIAYGSESGAFEPLAGEFVATRSGAAVQSNRTGANPGRIKLRVDRTYPVAGLNKPDGEYVQITIAGAELERRWAERNCGRLSTEPGHRPP